MTEMSVAQMDELEGGIDYTCLTWAAAGLGIGSLGGPVGAIGGAFLGYHVCTYSRASS